MVRVTSSQARPIRMARAQVSPMTPPCTPMNRSISGYLPTPPSTCRGVALEAPSTPMICRVRAALGGFTKAVMRLAKPVNSTMRATRAGLAKFMPMPPNSCFISTMAMKAPTIAIHTGMVTGMFSARIRPVTTAERSPTGLGFFIRRQYSHSNTTQAATVTPHSSRVFRPKMMVLATTQGSSAMITFSISLRVLELSWM